MQIKTIIIPEDKHLDIFRRYASNIHNLMNIRANCCRCLGALIRCLDGIACEQVEDPSLITENVEFRSVTLSIVDAIILNVSTGKAMKV